MERKREEDRKGRAEDRKRGAGNVRKRGAGKERKRGAGKERKRGAGKQKDEEQDTSNQIKNGVPCIQCSHDDVSATRFGILAWRVAASVGGGGALLL